MDELPEVAEWVLREASSNIIALKGEMGVGKTTLIKAICNKLGMEDEVSSPTFSLVNEYLSEHGPVYHFDFYRIKDEEEVLDIGLDEYLDSGNLCLMEWPEKIRNLIPDECAFVNISLDGQKRIYELIQPIK